MTFLRFIIFSLPHYLGRDLEAMAALFLINLQNKNNKQDLHRIQDRMMIKLVCSVNARSSCTDG